MLQIDNLGPAGLELTIHGTLHASDFKRLVPVAEERIRECGELSLLLHATRFEGLSAAALWEDLKFDVAHYRDIARVAIVGDETELLAVIARPFTHADVRRFPENELPAARLWVMSSTPPDPDMQLAGAIAG